jgi:hypothetical protein
MKPLINSTNVKRSKFCTIAFETPNANSNKPTKNITEPKMKVGLLGTFFTVSIFCVAVDI